MMMMIALYVLILNFIVNPTNLIYASLHCAKNFMSVTGGGSLVFILESSLPGCLSLMLKKIFQSQTRMLFFLIF